MKKIILSICSIVAIGSIAFISCTKKNDNTAITPGYSKDGLGTGANPNTTIVTTTGTVATTSTANQNSIFAIGGSSAWGSVGCVAGQTSLIVTNSSLGSNVTVAFNGAVAAGTFALVSNPSSIPAGSACITISNPSSQPTGTTWYSASGSIVVSISGTGFIGTFNNIPCYQSGSTFPSVTASGQAVCN